MKNTTLISLIIFAFLQSLNLYCDEVPVSKYQNTKGSIGLSYGMTFPVKSQNDVKHNGVNFDIINFSYCFNNNFGVSSALTAADKNIDFIGFFVGGIYVPYKNNYMSIDFKGMIGFLTAKVLDDNASSIGYRFGTSLHILPKEYPIGISLNLGYLGSEFNFDKLNIENDYNVINVNIGIEYLF